MENTPPAPGTYKGRTGDEWRRMAREQLEAARTQNDPKSRWEADLTARHHDLCAELADADGLTQVEGLFDLRGRLLDAYHGWGKYGDWWMLLDATGRRTENYLTPSRAQSDDRARRYNASKGYYIGSVMVPGKATIISATGSAGAASCYAAIVPMDNNITSKTVVRIIDNGQ